jgi:hypothetical protein
MLLNKERHAQAAIGLEADFIKNLARHAGLAFVALQ